MKTRDWLLPTLVMSLTALPSLAHAWGHQGHEAVGQIADGLLPPDVRKKVADLLQGQSLSTAAIWADCAKGAQPDREGRGQFTYTPSPRYPECQPFESPQGKQEFEDFVGANWNQCGAPKGTEHCHHQYHYSDVSVLRAGYSDRWAGANGHDVVHSINAAVTYLKTGRAPAPYVFVSPRIALMLLAHYVGDIHQPLHVEAVYLEPAGDPIDPDSGAFSDANETAGGNRLKRAGHTASFHHEWDEIPADLQVGGAKFAQLQNDAKAYFDAQSRSVPTPVLGWSASWASETMNHQAPCADVFAPGFRYTGSGTPAKPQWTISGEGQGYDTNAVACKAHQLSLAGARLAQVLVATFSQAQPLVPAPDAAPAVNVVATPAISPAPTCSAPPSNAVAGYLDAASVPKIAQWIGAAPVPPASRSDPLADLNLKLQAADEAGVARYQEGLKRLDDRASRAAFDDVYAPIEMAARFAKGLGKSLDYCATPTVLRMMARLEKDGEAAVAPVKRKVVDGGRKRPFVADPTLLTCLTPKDIAGKRHNDLDVYKLDESGSYPSTHALIGFMYGLLLGELRPERADAMLQWGMDFGESRVVCGFHYPSDVTAGRLVAASVLNQVGQLDEFKADLAKARRELLNAADR